jgi:tetratricopeptide (TPR) repeat protein
MFPKTPRSILPQFLIGAAVLAVAICPGCGWTPFGSKEGYLRRGNKFAQQEKYEDALLQFQKALQKDGNYGEAYLRYGQLLVRMNRTAEAFQPLTRAVQFLPASDEAKIELGRMAIAGLLGDPRHPQIYYQAAGSMAAALLAKNRNSFEALRIEGYLALADSRAKDTIEYFRKALQANPNAPDVVTMLVQTLVREGQGPEAESLARNALPSLKKYGPLYDSLYAYYISTNRPADAEQLLKSKNANNPKQASFVIQLAGHYWRQRNKAEMEAVLQQLLARSTEFSDAPLLVGDFYRSIGDIEGAVSVYQQGELSGREHKTDCMQRIASIRMEQGRIQEAAEILDTILKADSGNVEALITRADLRMATSQPDEMRKALAEFSALVQKAPGNLTARYSLARAYRQMGQEAEARSALQEILHSDPNHIPALRELADIAIRSQKPDEALRWADILLRVDPNDPQARLVRTAAWALSGRWGEVRAELRRLTAENPSLPEAWLQTATLDLEEKKYGDAEAIFKRLYQPGDRDIRALRGLATLALRQNQPQKALALVEQDAKRFNRLDLRVLLASIAVQAGNLDLALATAVRVAADFPQNPDHLIFVGQLYLRKGQLDLALASFAQAQKIAPGNSLADAHLADALAQAGRYTEAIAAARQGLKNNPDDASQLNNLAWYLASADTSLDEAATLAQRAVQNDPSNAGFGDTLGVVYLKSKKLDSAARCFQESILREPGNPTYRKHLAMVWIALGNRGNARTELETALRSNPNADEAGEIRKLLLPLR